MTEALRIIEELMLENYLAGGFSQRVVVTDSERYLVVCVGKLKADPVGPTLTPLAGEELRFRIDSQSGSTWIGTGRRAAVERLTVTLGLDRMFATTKPLTYPTTTV